MISQIALWYPRKKARTEKQDYVKFNKLLHSKKAIELRDNLQGGRKVLQITSDVNQCQNIYRSENITEKKSNSTREGQMIRHFSKEVQMVNKYVINSQVSPGIRTVEIKTASRAFLYSGNIKKYIVKQFCYAHYFTIY